MGDGKGVGADSQSLQSPCFLSHTTQPGFLLRVTWSWSSSTQQAALPCSCCTHPPHPVLTTHLPALCCPGYCGDLSLLGWPQLIQACSSKHLMSVPHSQAQPGFCWPEQPAPSTLTTVPGCCWSLTMGAPRWPTRAGLGGSWFSSMMQGEVIPRGARYSAIITVQYTSSRNTLRPVGRDREDRGLRYRGSILQAIRNKPRLLHLALTYGCPRSA